MKEGDKVNVTDQKTNADLEAGIDSTKREFASDGFSETKADSRDDKGDNSRTGRDSGHQNSVFAAISNFFNAILTWVAAPFLVILGLITGNSSAIDNAGHIDTVGGSSPDNGKGKSGKSNETSMLEQELEERRKNAAETRNVPGKKGPGTLTEDLSQFNTGEMIGDKDLEVISAIMKSTAGKVAVGDDSSKTPSPSPDSVRSSDMQKSFGEISRP